MRHCEFCGKPIQGDPIEVDDNLYCSLQCAEEEAELEAAEEEASTSR